MDRRAWTPGDQNGFCLVGRRSQSSPGSPFWVNRNWVWNDRTLPGTPGRKKQGHRRVQSQSFNHRSVSDGL